MSAGAAARRARRWRELLPADPSRPRSEICPLTELYPQARIHQLWPGETVETPELETIRLHHDWDGVARDAARTPDVWVAEMDDALVDMGRNVVLDRDGSRVVEESVAYPAIDEAQPWPPDPAVFDRPRVEVQGTAAVFRCFAVHRNHYHSLIDALPRLHGLIADGRLAEREIRLLVDGELGIAESHVLPRVLPQNITVHEVAPGSIVEAETLLFPGYVTIADVGILARKYLDWFVPQVVPERPSRRCERIYVSRRDVGVRRVQNEPEVIDGLLTRGFIERDLTHMPMNEQIRLFYDAETVVAPHGAGLANLVFGTGAGVVELFNSPFVRPHYYYLSKAVGHRWRHVVSHRLSKDDDFSVDVGAVIRHVDELADEIE